MIKKNTYPTGSTFYRVKYEIGIYNFFLDFCRGRNNELIFVAGSYQDWMVSDAVTRIVDSEK